MPQSRGKKKIGPTCPLSAKYGAAMLDNIVSPSDAIGPGTS
jgi:hypothetical protein